MGNKAKGAKPSPGRRAKPGSGTPKRKLKTDAEVPVPAGVDEELLVSDEDIDFVASHASSLGFLTGDDFDQDTLKVSKKQKREAKGQEETAQLPPQEKKPKVKRDIADDKDLQTYEAVPRAVTQEKKPSRSVLPIKTGTGEVVFEKPGRPPAAVALPTVPGVHVEADDEDEDEEMSGGGSDDEGEEDEEEDEDGESIQDMGIDEGEEGARQGLAMDDQQQIRTELLSYQDRVAYREEAKTSIASAASKVTQEPEKSLGELKTLLGLCADSDAQVASWAMLSLLMVFRDILPGYRIRLPTAEEASVRVSKEVARLRGFESGLLRAYQAYLKLLLQAAKKGAATTSVSQVAVKCMSGLLETHFYFNYASDLLTALVPRMADRNPGIRKPAAAALAAIVRGDEEGQIAMDAVQLVADLVKKRKCNTPPDLVWALLEVKVTEVSREELQRLKEAAQGGKIKKLKKKKGKTTEDKQLEKDFREAAGEVDVRVKVRLQSRMLDALFEIFFRVLKSVEASGSAEGGQVTMSPRAATKRWPLLEPTLAGIEQMSHLISVEFFGDLLLCLTKLTVNRRLPMASRARALASISGILTGQGAALTVDHHSFHSSLYAALLDVPLLPLDEEDGGDDSELQIPAKHNIAGVMTLKALARGIVDPKSTDITRLSSFVKRCAGVAASVESGESLGYLCAAGRLLRRHFKLRGMLEAGMLAAGGIGARSQIQAEDEDPSVGGWIGCPLWELSLLARHFNPEVASAANGLACMTTGGEVQLPPVLGGSRGPVEVAAAYSTRGGAFCPPPKAPQKSEGNKRQRSDPSAHTKPMTLEEEEVALAMMTHFRGARSFARNAELRREMRGLSRKLRAWEERSRATPKRRA